jgi:uncharacterized cupin superfamily protein
MTYPILNIVDVELKPRPAANTPKGATVEKFDMRIGMIASRLGAQKLGYNLTAVPPGKCAFPKHSHRVNEEMFFVIEGTGELTVGDTKYSIKQGDVIACPPGGKETAHQILNTGTSELVYLAVSTRIYPDICDYPDSNKMGVFNELPAGADGRPQFTRFIGREAQSLDYWDGE